MQEAVLDQELSKLDLSKVAALQQKRTLAFVNHFVVSTVQFLNTFMKECEQKLMLFERKLEKVEAAMVLLETRLSSIPEVHTLVPEAQKQDTVDSHDQATLVQASADNTDLEQSKETESKVQISPECERFVKMVQVGVPLPAVKLKMTVEGLDPDMLDKILGK